MQVLDFTSAADETEPVEAVVLHRAGGRIVGLYHNVVEASDGGRPELDAGTPLTHEMARDFSQRLSGGGGRILLPASVLLADSDLLAWWSPAQRRPIFFNTASKEWDARMDKRAVLHPPLVFLARPGQFAPTEISVFALRESRRPGANTHLLRAPYFNLYATGFMCDGDVPLPSVLQPTRETIDGFERGFYDSSFAHSPLGKGELVKWPGGHNGFWEAMANPGLTDFPAECLFALYSGQEPVTLERVVQTDAHRLLIDPD